MFSNNQFLDNSTSQEESQPEHYKYVEYEYIDMGENTHHKNNRNDEKQQLQKYYEKQVIPILRPIKSFGNRFLLGNDLYLNLDLVFYPEQGEVTRQTMLNEFKNVNSIHWNQKRQYLRIQLETSQQYVYDYSLLIYQLQHNQNNKYAQCVVPLKRYEQYCKAQYQANEGIRRKYTDYQNKVQQFVTKKNNETINSINFENKYIFILEKGFDVSNNQFGLQSTYYSEQLLDLVGVFHGLNMFGIDRSEMTNLIIRLGVINIFTDISSMEHTMSYFLYQNQRQENQVNSSEINLDFYTLDNIRIQCKARRTQFNANLDIEQQLSQKDILQTMLQISYELFIPSDLVAKINAQRFQQLKYFSKLTDKLSREEAKQYCVNGEYPKECKSFLQKYYKDVLNKEVKNINSNFYDLSWLNNF